KGDGRQARFLREAQRQFRSFIAGKDYPCLGAKVALNADACDLNCYPMLGGKAGALARDLMRFIDSPRRRESKFATFVALFRAPLELTELAFENLLWLTLQHLNQVDAIRHSWDSSVASDPSRADFAFSFGGVAFYVVAMHRNSSRWARRFDFPTLV